MKTRLLKLIQGLVVAFAPAYLVAAEPTTSQSSNKESSKKVNTFDRASMIEKSTNNIPTTVHHIEGVELQ